MKKVAVAVTTAALAFGGLAATAGPAAATKVALGDAHGTVSCSITGKVKIKPALSDINTLPSTVTAKTKSLSCTGTVSGLAVTKSKGKVVSVGTSPGTCSGLLTPGTSPFTVEIKWTVPGASLNNSVVTFANQGPSGLGFNLPANGAADAATSVVTGSFSGEKAWAHADIDSGPVLAAFTATDGSGCAPNAKGKAKGIKKLTIVGGTFNLLP